MESQRAAQERSILEREEEQGWVEVTRLRHAIAQKADENRMLSAEVEDLWQAIRQVGAHNEEILRRIGKQATEYSKFTKPRGCLGPPH